MIAKILLFTAVCFLAWTAARSEKALAVNPYLPLWEHIPDGEPRLFEDPDQPGKFRVYLYGSHDTRRDEYCGYDIPVWSAPVEDLTDWRYDGIAFQSVVDGKADILFAPDVVEVVDSNGKKTYYLYPNNQSWGRNSQVAKADRPDGPFEVINWKDGKPGDTEGVMGFDPAVFVDEDGRVYGYWGFKRSFGVELDPETMYSAKPGTAPIVDLLGSCEAEDGNVFRYFEAPSLRKVEDKYVLVYSRVTEPGEYGLGPSNATLAYAYSDNPLGPWTYGGTIVDARAPEIGEDGEMIATSPSHNTHGSILEANGQWYIFYHRSTDNHGFARQAIVEPINVEVTPEGRVVITGTRIIKDRVGNEYTGAEVTSQGFAIDGLKPEGYYSAGIACCLIGSPYVKALYDEESDHNPVVNIRNNSVVGYKYFNFTETSGKVELEIELIPCGAAGEVEVLLDSPWEKQGGVKVGSVKIGAESADELTAAKVALPELEGERALYFRFKSEGEEPICELVGLRFVTG